MPLRRVRLPDGPLRFTIRCPYCGQVLDVIPVTDEDWHAAAAWGYLVARAHDDACPNRRRAAPEEGGPPA